MTASPPRSRQKKLSTRDIALQVLVGVHKRSVYSDKLLESLSARYSLDRRERAFLNELTKGTLKRRGTLDAVLGDFVHVGLDSLPAWIQNSLRLGAYQLLFLDRVPAHAAVSESVSLARKYGHPGTAGLVNSVLRRLSDTSREELLGKLDSIADERDRLAATTSHPRWILDRWLTRFSFDEVRQLAEANNRNARLALRVNRHRLDRGELIARLARQGHTAKPARWSRVTVLLEGEIDFTELKSIERGECSVQDESETLVGQVVAPLSGERVLELCAAPGGKSGHLAELMGDRGELVAVEKTPGPNACAA